MASARQHASRVCLLLACAGGCGLLLAGERQTPAALAITRGVVELPTSEIPPRGKAVFTVRAGEQDLAAKVLLRFEAILRHRTESGLRRGRACRGEWRGSR